MIDKSAFVHPTAIVEEGASIGANAHIGPFCIVGPHVEIGEGTVLKSHVVVNGHTKIGRDNEIYQFASIGEVNQDLKYAGEPTRVEIGDRNRIRESVTIHRGTVQGGGLTKVGSDNLLMINAHIAHDCTVGNRCILANNATLAGHVSVDDFAIIGGMTAVHQFCIIGAHVMVGGCSGVAQDVPPYVIAQGNHATPFGVNIEGLKRRGFMSAGIFIEGRYSGMILLVNTETEREWSRADCAAVSEMARIVASGIKNTSLLIEAKQEAEYYRNHDALTGLMRYDRFKESCQMLMDEGKEEYVLVASDIKGFKFITLNPKCPPSIFPCSSVLGHAFSPAHQGYLLICPAQKIQIVLYHGLSQFLKPAD